MVIRDNYVKAAGGDGITAMYALRPLVEHNTADSVACEINDRIYCRPENRAGKVAAGIWPWKCKDALFRCNEVADTRLNQTGWLTMRILVMEPFTNTITADKTRADALCSASQKQFTTVFAIM